MIFVWDPIPGPYILRVLFIFALGKTKCAVCIVCLGNNLNIAEDGASVECHFGK